MLRMNSTFAQVILAAACLLMSGLGQAADAGRVVSVTGDVKIVRGVAVLPAAKNAKLQTADEVRTGSPGQAYWGMTDGSRFAIRENSSFRIDNFQPKSSERGGTAVYSLLKGAFRTVSGLIGKLKTDTYQVNTPVATMGIRGTDYAAVMKADGGKGGHPDGLYFHVLKGKISVGNNAGTVEFSEGQSGYVKDINTLAKLMNTKDLQDIFSNFAEGSIFAEGAFNNAGFDFGLDIRTPSIEIPRIEPPDLPPVPAREIPASPS